MRISDSELLFKRMTELNIDLYESNKGKIVTAIVPEILDCSYEDRTATFRYPFPTWMLNPNNVMHGGISALLMDNSMGCLSSTYIENERTTPTISMNLSYFNPVPPGAAVIIKAKIQQITRKIIYAYCELYSEYDTSNALVSATGTYYRR